MADYDPAVYDNTPRLICQRFVDALKFKLSWTDAQVFIAAAADGAAQGLPPENIQVVPGSVGVASAAGDQDGDRGIYLRLTVDLVLFQTLNVDMPDRSSEIIKAEGYGMLDLVERIREIFVMTYLGGIVLEKVKFEGETATVWIDPDAGKTMRTLTYSACWQMRYDGNEESVDLPEWHDGSQNPTQSQGSD
jgi:hypothetical protein